MADPLHEELIRQAAEAARAGNRDAAMRHLGEVLEEDETNVKAWLLFARLTRDNEEKFVALNTVLEIDPRNVKAKQMMAKLETATRTTARQDEEVMPGVSKREVMLVAGGIGGFVVLALLIFVVITVVNNNREKSQQREIERLYADQTATLVSMIEDEQATQIAYVHATETQVAIATPTPTPRPTSAAPTLPPTPTPTEDTSATGPSLYPPPAGLTGVLSGWSGNDLLNIDAMAQVVYTLTGAPEYVTPRVIKGEYGMYGFLSPDRTRMIYTNFNRRNNALDLVLIDMEGEPIASHLDDAARLGLFMESYMPVFSPDGAWVAFIGDALDTDTPEVYVVDLTDTSGSPLVRLTTDQARYSHPSFSPDGKQLVVVRENPSNIENPGPDLVIIDIRSRTMASVTRDNAATRETTPRFSPLGDVILYAATTEQDARSPHNLYLIAVDNPGSGRVILENFGHIQYPVVSPDGSHVAFSSNQSGYSEIYIMNLASYEIFQMTHGIDEDYVTHWLPLLGDEIPDDMAGDASPEDATGAGDTESDDAGE